MTRTPLLAVLLGTAVVLAGAVACDDPVVFPPTTPPPTLPPREPPTIPEVSGATRGASVGETVIRLVAADPLPGATLEGCGAGASGCGGRIRMTFELQSSAGGPALGLLAFLHSDRATACFVALVPPFVLEPRTRQNVEVVLGPADTDEVCFTPLEITHLAAVVEGTVEVSARQEWALRYHLER